MFYGDILFSLENCRRSAKQNCLNNVCSDGQTEVQASVDLFLISQASGFTREEQQTVHGHCAAATAKKNEQHGPKWDHDLETLL